MNNMLDSKITAKKLVNESGLNKNIKTLEEINKRTKGEIKKITNKGRIKIRIR